jgi:hypothetical protein
MKRPEPNSEGNKKHDPRDTGFRNRTRTILPYPWNTRDAGRLRPTDHSCARTGFSAVVIYGTSVYRDCCPGWISS